ncbi:MAG TPA: phenylalanine--tRNA ligase subunit beta [Gemmatimonadales bacterium]|jgi:phenylalanyl-tRNA synthetase beta chain|nr:phenylalanine--tRNA ligase subunit beta [Gemmatimonadales bacterium]
MNISRKWLEAFLRRKLDARDIAERLAMLGAPVDAIESTGAELAPFVVALVTDVRPHPGADKLRVTTVDDGSGTLYNVVCGAPNVTAGNKYPFARLGTQMPGGMVIERRKLRGEVSEGMLCSARELGLGEDHDGLLTLNTALPPGTPLLDVLDAGDDRLVVDVTPNRGDLLGHKGVARELAASLGVPFRLPDIPHEANVDLPTPVRFGDEAPAGGVRVAIDDADGCGRLLAAVLRGVKVGPSPAWLKERLASVGVRSINNIVDATNYVMFELNQPMHAYDVDTLRGPAVIARASNVGEMITTLDGVERKLPAGTLIIADAERAIGVAGVMGGAATEVRDTTTSILLECAWFNPSRVRRGRRALGLSTDASHRFERGTDRWGAVDAFRRCVRLIVTVAGGALDGATVDCFPAPVHPPRIFLRPARVTQVLGVTLAWSNVEKHLVAAGATVVSKPEDGRIAVDVPGWRSDITAEIDLIEEIARIHGYTEIPTDLRPFRPGARQDDPAWAAAARLRAALVAAGLAEVMTLPMVAANDPRYPLSHDKAPLVLNPLSAEHGALRHTLLPSLAGQVEANWAMQTAEVRLFEIGTTFERMAGAAPRETLTVAFAMTGATRPRHWTDAGSASPFDRWDARALFEQVVGLAHPGATVQVADGGWLALAPDGGIIGRCGELFADAPPWAAPLFGGEVAVSAARRPTVTYCALPAFPAATRDMALVVPEARTAADVMTLLHQRGARHGLESVSVVDEYRGPSLPPATRSIAVRLVFRAADRTLTDAEVEQSVHRLRTSLERELDVTVRTS